MRNHFTWQAAVITAPLDATTKLVLLVVGSYMNQHGRGAFPSYKLISEGASIHRSTAIRAIDKAVEAGWLVKKARANGDGQTSNAYSIGWPKGSSAERPPEAPKVVAQDDHLVAQDDQGSRTERPGVVAQDDPNTPVLTPQLTPHKKKGARKPSAPSFDASTVELPCWLDRQDWLDWVQDRKDRKKPITEKAAPLQIKKLGKYRSEGYDPKSVIENSIEGGYQGLFPSRDSQQRKPSATHEKFDPVAFVNKNRTDHGRNHSTIIDV